MKKHTILIAVLSIASILILNSCKKENLKSAETDTHARPNNFTSPDQVRKVYVSTINELYSAVNNPDNAGSQVVLAPGTYLLDASYPNGGRLELQENMSLVGQPGQQDAVLIDQSSLPNSSYRLTLTTSTGGIRVGKGNNSLEWLSLKGGAFASTPFSVIETDLQSTETTIGISHVKIDCNGSRLGVVLRNRGPEHENRIINANLEHNEIYGAVNIIGFGLALQNRISGSKINLNSKENYIHGNKIGILLFNAGLTNTVENCEANILSFNDRIEGNGCGIDPSGGSNGSVSTQSSNNTVTFKMYGTSIRDNNPTGHPELTPNNGALRCGIYAAGGYGTNVLNNTLNMGFWGCDISNNNGTDIYAYGAYSPTAVVAGTNNLCEMFLYGLSANATTVSEASVPFEPAGTNVVNIYRF